MLTKTNYTVDIQTIQEALILKDFDSLKNSINQPTGDFFYDPWVISNEFKGTPWETLLNSLPNDIGEARHIILTPGKCYQSHADIDDRYHLNLAGDNCFLIDIDNRIMEPLLKDGTWYELSTDRLHSAANFGDVYRHQLVVRKLLIRNQLKDPRRITFTSTLDPAQARYIFDNKVSLWLNKANKQGLISAFSYEDGKVEFDIELSELETLTRLLNGQLIVKIL
jgi:hypothetical protein